MNKDETKRVKIIYESEPVGIGSTILRGLHRLYYCTPDEILYFHFTNILYGGPNKNVWAAYLKQPFEPERQLIEEAYNNKNTLEERGVFLNKNNSFLFCYGKEQNNASEFSNIDSVAKYRELVATYLKFNDKLLTKVDSFCEKYITNKRVISLHKRGTDQFTSRGHAGNVIAFTDERLKDMVENSLKDYDFIFLATDEDRVYKLLKESFGDKILSYSTMRSQEGDTRGTHFAHVTDTEENKYILGEEAIIDFLIMSRCSYSLCMKSNLSLLTILMRNDFNYKFVDNHIQYDKLG